MTTKSERRRGGSSFQPRPPGTGLFPRPPAAAPAVPTASEPVTSAPAPQPVGAAAPEAPPVVASPERGDPGFGWHEGAATIPVSPPTEAPRQRGMTQVTTPVDEATKLAATVPPAAPPPPVVHQAPLQAAPIPAPATPPPPPAVEPTPVQRFEGKLKQFVECQTTARDNPSDAQLRRNLHLFREIIETLMKAGDPAMYDMFLLFLHQHREVALHPDYLFRGLLGIPVDMKNQLVGFYSIMSALYDHNTGVKKWTMSLDLVAKKVPNQAFISWLGKKLRN